MQYIQHELPQKRIPNFYSLTMLYLASAIGIVFSNDLFNVYVFMEISSIVSYALVATSDEKYSKLTAFNYLIIITISATLYLIAVFLLYSVSGTLNISDVANFVANNNNNHSVYISFLFICIAFLMKMAVFPFHSWLINAYRYSPISIVNVFSSISTKISAFLLLKLVNDIFGTHYFSASILSQIILFCIAPISIVLGAVYAYKAKSFRTLLAFSSVSQMGFILLGLIISSVESIKAVLFLMVSHGIAKAALFMSCGMLQMLTGDSDVSSLSQIKEKFPMLKFAIIISALSLLGFPLTAGFIPKWNLILSAWNEGNIIALLFIAVGSAFSLLYVFRIIEIFFLEKSDDQNKKYKNVKIPLLCYVAILFLSISSIFLGIFPEIITDYFDLSISTDEMIGSKKIHWVY